MPLNWINLEEFPFDSLLLTERFQINLMFDNRDDEWKQHMGMALRRHPAVRWYLTRRCPERAALIEEIAANAADGLTPEDIRKAEVYVMGSVEDFITYTRPEIMDQSCDFIYAWNKERLFELADFSGKVVLDIGSGSGRLAFAAAERARFVYASEPVGTLREYLRDKIAREGIANLRVLDGMANSLPFPNDCFDIVMSGHVVGDDYENEIAEMTRVVKSGGLLLDCPGEDPRKCKPSTEFTRRGWEEFYYASVLGGDVYRYRKQVEK